MTEFVEGLICRSPVIVRRRISWGDCDPACVVYTPRFADYVVSARDWFMRIALGLTEQPVRGNGGVAYPARALSFDFVSFLEPDDWLDMTVRVLRIGRTTFDISVAGCRRGAAPVFKASLTSICFDLAERQALALPPAIRDALAGYEIAQPPA